MTNKPSIDRARTEIDHIAKIIEEECGWMVGWSTGEDRQNECWQKAAKRIRMYLARRSR